MLDSTSSAASSPGDGTSGGDKFGLKRETWIKIGILAALFIFLFWPNLRRLWDKTNPITGEDNWKHAIFIPIIGLYYLYLNREQLLKEVVKPLLPDDLSRSRWISSGAFILGGLLIYLLGKAVLTGFQATNISMLGLALSVMGVLALALNWGLACLVGGILLTGYGIWPGRNDYVNNLGMVLTLFGVVLTLSGWRIMRIAWFPIAFLVCAIPWPALVYSWVAMPLQHIAAWVAVKVLQITGVEAEVIATKISMIGHKGEIRMLNVAEACAGMRSLMTFIAVGAAMAFLSARPLWQKLVITLSAIPIAIGCNTMRVAGQGLIDYYVSQELSQGFAHQFAGMIMLLPAFFLLALVGWVLDQLFVEEVDDKHALLGVKEQARKLTISAPPPAAGATVSRRSHTTPPQS